MAENFWGKWLSRQEDTAKKMVNALPVDKIKPNPYQPRLIFSEEELEELSESIKVHGLLQPILVTKSASETDEYTLVVGERRLRATKLAGLTEIPAIIGEFEDKELAEMALVENLQRKNLTPVEEAIAYREVLEKFNLTQQELAKRLGKGQSTIANKLRLLSLPGEVQEHISREIITERHARALLRLGPESIIPVAQEVVSKGLTVQQTEALVERVLSLEAEQSRQKKVIRIFKDARLFRNSVLKLVGDLKASGLEVSVSEDKEDENYSITINISKSNRGQK